MTNILTSVKAIQYIESIDKIIDRNILYNRWATYKELYWLITEEINRNFSKELDLIKNSTHDFLTFDVLLYFSNMVLHISVSMDWDVNLDRVIYEIYNTYVCDFNGEVHSELDYKSKW